MLKLGLLSLVLAGVVDDKAGEPRPRQTKILAINGATMQVPNDLVCRRSDQAWADCTGGDDGHLVAQKTAATWLLSRTNSGVADAPPRLDGLRQSVVGRPRVRRLRVIDRQAGGQALVFRQARWLVCLVAGNESLYAISAEIKGAPEAVRRAEVQTACETLRFVPLTNRLIFRPDAPPYLTAYIPAAQRLKVEKTVDGMVKLWDAKTQLHMKIVRWVAKGGSPYNTMRYDPVWRLAPQTFISNRLRRQGCKPKRVKKHRVGDTSGWLVRCLVDAADGQKGNQRVLAFLRLGEDIILITWQGEDSSWSALEAGAGELLRGAWIF